MNLMVDPFASCRFISNFKFFRVMKWFFFGNRQNKIITIIVVGLVANIKRVAVILSI